MLVTSGVATLRYEEVIREGQRLGRHLALDSRSLAYTIEADLEAMRKPIKPMEWPSPLPVLDQGERSSCVGNAGTYALSSLVGKDRLAGILLNGLALFLHEPGDVNGEAAAADEDWAVELYSEATTDDGFAGNTFPPIDSGSSALGVCRALKRAGLIGGYRWALSLHGFAVLLQQPGTMLGTPWFSAFDEPDRNAFVDVPNWQSSSLRGGHEVHVEALETWNDRQPESSVIRFRQSWGEWGDNGCGRMRLGTYQALRQQSDVKSLVPKAA